MVHRAQGSDGETASRERRLHGCLAAGFDDLNVIAADDLLGRPSIPRVAFETAAAASPRATRGGIFQRVLAEDQSRVGRL